MALCRAFSEIFNVEKYHDLEIAIEINPGQLDQKIKVS